jgi:hypothetical protein
MPRFVVLEFSRSPKWFLDCFVSGMAMEGHRSAMLAVGRPCILGEGAKLIVAPSEVNDVLLHLSRAGVAFDEDSRLLWEDLRPRHVIVSESWEADVMAALAATAGSGLDGGKGKENVRVKRRVVIDMPPAPVPCHRAPLSEGSVSDGSDDDCFLAFAF